MTLFVVALYYVTQSQNLNHKDLSFCFFFNFTQDSLRFCFTSGNSRILYIISKYKSRKTFDIDLQNQFFVTFDLRMGWGRGVVARQVFVPTP